MRNSSHPRRAAGLLLIMLVVLATAACSRPSDEVLRQGIAGSAQIQLTRMNPLAVTAEVSLRDYKITNSYKKDGVLIYEYEGTVVAKGGFGNPNPGGQAVTVRGSVRFRKAGNRWDASPF